MRQEAVGLIQKKVYHDFESSVNDLETLQHHSIPHAAVYDLFPSKISAMMRSFFCSSASLLISLNTASMSSSDLPAVSGMRKNVKTKARAQKTAKKTYAPSPVFWMSGGVTRPMIYDIY